MLKKICNKILCFAFGTIIGFLIIKIGPTFDPSGSLLSAIINKDNGELLSTFFGNTKLFDSVFIGVYYLLAFAPSLIVFGFVIGIICTKIKNKRILAYSVLTWPAIITLAGSYHIRSIYVSGSEINVAVGQYLSSYFSDNTFKLFIVFASFYFYMTISYIILNKLKAGPNHKINRTEDLPPLR